MTEGDGRRASGDRVWDLTVSTLSDLVDRVEPLAHTRAVAGAAARVIEFEQLLQRGMGLPGRVLASLGIAPTREVAQVREELEALAARVDPSVTVRSPRAAPVNWREGGAGPPLLLLNGWSASGLVWPAALVRELEERYRVIRPDNRGTGWSRTAPAPFTVADLADDAAEVLREARVTSATVLGLSMGGMIAQELALRHPALVDRLVVVASRPPAPAVVTAGASFLGETLRSPGDRRVSQHLEELWGGYCAPGFAQAHPQQIQELVSQILRRPTPRACLLQQVRAMGAWSGPQRLSAIQAPSVVVHGTDDPLMPVANGMRLARLIPGADYVELQHVGHLVHVEAGDRLVGVLDEAEHGRRQPVRSVPLDA